mgnify:CR=1 FL=1
MGYATSEDRRQIEAAAPWEERDLPVTVWQQIERTAGRVPDRPAMTYQMFSGPKDKAETLTFDKQEREARQWQTDNSVTTPYIDAMLAERPLEKAELVGRILAKADAFTMASGMATGKRQRLEDELKAAVAVNNQRTIEKLKW